MKTASPELVSLLNSGNFVFWDLYTITLNVGSVIRFTDANFSISSGGFFDGSSLLINSEDNPSTASWKLGLDVSNWTVAVMPRTKDPITGELFPDKIGSVPWTSAARRGYLDGAKFLVERAYFASTPTYPIPVSGAPAVGKITVFLGSVATVDISEMKVILTANDYRELLDTNMPRNVYQSGCRRKLFDAGCTLNSASYINNMTITGTSTRSTLVSGNTVPSGSGSFTLGRVVFTSGSNTGFQRTVLNWSPGSFTLQNPLPYAPSVGDTFQAYPGCDKTLDDCEAFNNLLNFGGEPYIPAAELAV
jgi:hypothetical protein